LFIGLALVAGVHQTTAQVTNLGIARLRADNPSLLALSTTNYVLQKAMNLAAPNSGDGQQWRSPSMP